MHIVLANRATIPVFAYGGTERVIWDLGYALTQLGHKVTYLVSPGSHCDFADVIFLDPAVDLRTQIPADADIVHFQFQPEFDLDGEFALPYAMTEHGNTDGNRRLPLNSIFVSRNHAERHGSDQFVYNGLNWDSYGKVDFERPRRHHHFLGKAAWRVKNVQGAIDVALAAKVRLAVLGGTRLNLKRGFRFTCSRQIDFYGMVGGEQKFSLLNASNGMIFPVRWHEPFGLAIIESLYFGCPVFGTPYGSLPELLTKEFGVLAASVSELAEAIQHHQFDPRACHHYARTRFDALTMARGYLEKYESILADQTLHESQLSLCSQQSRLPWLS